MRIYKINLLILGAIFFLSSSVCNAVGLSTYYHNDHLGSPVYASDEFGAVKWEQEYKPYGEKQNNSTAVSGNDIWFTGKTQDEDTGLIYMNARYYDPILGRFMAPDPIGFTDANTMSFNRYLYVNNNPYKYNDPDGEFLNFIVGGAFAAAQNIALQHIEIALGVREQFSYGELAAETALGVVTSGASTIKNVGRVSVTAVKYTNKADNVSDTAKAASDAKGIVYLRRNPRTGEPYVGQANSNTRYVKRQSEHDRKLNETHEFEILGVAKPGKDLDVLEETMIRMYGGLKKEGGPLANKRHQMSEANYRKHGGTVDNASSPPPPPPI